MSTTAAAVTAVIEEPSQNVSRHAQPFTSKRNSELKELSV